MANSYTQIYIQVVFAVKGRESFINSEWEERLYQYITGIIQNKGQKMIAINGMPDHLHVFIGMKPDCCLSDLVREVKKASNEWINDNKLLRVKFYWQEGFGAFSYSKSQIDSVVKYLMNQKQHHKKTTFKEEYLAFLKKYEIEYNEKYLFDWIE
jgi:putative transposase